MKLNPIFLTIFFLFPFVAYACPVCEKQQPWYTFGLSHGIGPERVSDALIVFAMFCITLAVLYYSIKFLVAPKEVWDKSHIKRTILEFDKTIRNDE